LKNKAKNILLNPKIRTEKVDVYSYAMTSYEVLTGCILFQNLAANDYDSIIRDARSPLPNYIDHEIQELVRRCWHPEPSTRPTLRQIQGKLHEFIIKRMMVFKNLPNGERDAEALRWLEVDLLGATR
jgi:serine/threonine protein kinase